jgi:Fe-S-cluster-containing dehydrogenase component
MPEMNDPGTPQDVVETQPDTQPTEPLSRRRLVVSGLVAVGAAAIAAGTLGRAANVAAAGEPLSTRVVVTDPTLCVGCLACEVNCSTWHESVGRSALPRIHILSTPDVKLRASVAAYLPARAGFSAATCRQCPTPWCLPNCPTTGLRIDPTTGNRYIYEEDCIACGKCEVDCPVEWEGTLALKAQTISSKRVVYDPALNVYTKCDLCIGREGGPICVERCPVNVAIRAGYIKSDNLALDLKPSTEEQWKRLV